MTKHLLKTFVALLAIAAAAAGPVRGQNASPDVTLDFTTNDWGLPAGKNNKTYAANSYTSGDYTITLQGGGGSSNGYYFNTDYLLLGKTDAYLQLPAFGSAVDSIQVVGTSSVSAQVTQNIYVDENNSWVAVSTQTGARGTNTYVINESYRAAGNIYFIKVDNSYNTQIKKVLVYFTPASSGGGSGSETPTPGQNSYNVTFGGFSESEMNTTVNVTSLPQTFTQIGDDALYPWTVISTAGNIFFGATVTSGGEGKVSVSVPNDEEMSITVTGPFEGTAIIHVTGEDDENRDISCDITVSCVSNAPAAPVPHTVRFASGNDGWTVTDVDSAKSATAPAILQNVMAGDSLVVTAPTTLPGKVKSVKAVKYVPPAATVTTAPTATEATIAANSTAALVNAGTANGGTMMYAVTTTNVQPASTADFSATIPTAEGRAAGTYYVWYYAKADDSHTDSEISATAVAVTVNGIVWTSSDMTSNFYAYFDGWTYNNTHQGITVTASGDAQGGWSQNNIDVNDGSGTITFTSSVGNIKSIVISAVNLNNMNMSAPAGWTANAMMNNPRTLSWSGTASATVNLPLSNMQNIGGISTIVFTLE